MLYLGKMRKARRNVRLAGNGALATVEVYNDVEGFLNKEHWINQRRE
jgi:hypothetical protein